MKEKLTQKNVAGLDSKIGKTWQCFDTERKELVLWSSPTKKTWYFQKTHKYIKFRKAIGNFMDISREQAILKCNELNSNLDKFGALEPEKAKEPIKNITMGEIYSIYSKTIVHRQRTDPFWDLYISRFKDKSPSKIKRSEVLDMFHSISKAHPVTANRVISRMRAAINHAIKNGLYEGINPATLIPKNHEEPRQIYLMPSVAGEAEEKLKALSAQKIHHDGADAALLMLYTWQRKGNVMAMRFSEVDETGTWHIGWRDYKSRRGHDTVLCTEALDILRRRKQEHPESDFVFPQKGNPEKHVLDCKKTFATFKKELGLSDFHQHDLRHTGATYALKAGESIATISKNLGHTNVSFTAKTYAHVMLDSQAEAVKSGLEEMRKKKSDQ